MDNAGSAADDRLLPKADRCQSTTYSRDAGKAGLPSVARIRECFFRREAWGDFSFELITT
jgi:hypothetical protein